MSKEKKDKQDQILWVSREGYQILLERRDKLIELIRKKKLELGRVAAEDHDLPENIAFKELRVELMFNLPRKMADLNLQFSRAQIIEESEEWQKADFKTVCLGSTVMVGFGENDIENFTILGPIEVDVNKGIISYESPLGVSLLGKSVGDKALINSPDGSFEVTVLSIKRGIEG